MTSTTATPVVVTYASGRTSRFSSIRNASRALSGNGSDRLSTSIRRRITAGGGFVGTNGVHVQRA